MKVIEGRFERRKGRCHPCERYLGVTIARVDFVYLDAPTEVAGVTLDAGWYCERCLKRAKRET